MKIFLAGTNSLKNYPQEFGKINYILESFYSIKNWQLPLIKQCKMFLLDSGAFTFMNSFKGEVNWDDYIEKYAKFINDNNIDYFFELDIDCLVGIEEVERLRHKLESLTQKKCIPVWHKSRGLDYWKRITKEYSYVAIGGIVTKEITKTDYKNFKLMLEIAKRNMCNVHALGFTNTLLLNKYKFFSVDSTSWTSGTRFGSIAIFKNKCIKNYKFNNMRAKKKIQLHNLSEWIKFQQYADKFL